MTLKKVLVLYGGKSTEHEVSVHSAQTVCNILATRYQVYPVFISKQGYWFLQKKCSLQTPQDIPVTPVLRSDGIVQALDGSFLLQADVVFPVVHGTNCEDGTLQGFLETLQVPYVGCGVLTSAVGMDKVLTKTLARQAGLPVLEYRVLTRGEAYDKAALEEWVCQHLPVFVKPVRLGSSVGVSKVTALEQLDAAVQAAFAFDTQVMVEQGVDHAREIFCAIYGTAQRAKVSLCGELRSLAGEFFDYNAKYVVSGGCETQVPAKIDPTVQEAMRKDTVVLFRALQGCGLARVDFLMDKDGRYYMSEINTMPGMSHTSLFPQLFQASGENYEAILDELLTLAVEVHTLKEKLSFSR